MVSRLDGIVGGSEKGAAGVAALGEIHAVLNALEIDESRAVFDPSIVRGLGYYTGPVFEAEILTAATYDDGKPIQFGSVGGGGRYDDLVSRFTGQAVPATGYSFGVTRFASVLAALGMGDAEEARPFAIVLNVEKDRVSDYLGIASELRAAGIRAEAFLGGGNMGKQLKYADRREADAAIIIGEDERESNTVTIKDLKLGARLARQISDNKEWREEQPAQKTVARQDLVAAIKAMVTK